MLDHHVVVILVNIQSFVQTISFKYQSATVHKFVVYADSWKIEFVLSTFRLLFSSTRQQSNISFTFHRRSSNQNNFTGMVFQEGDQYVASVRSSVDHGGFGCQEFVNHFHTMEADLGFQYFIMYKQFIYRRAYNVVIQYHNQLSCAEFLKSDFATFPAGE